MSGYPSYLQNKAKMKFDMSNQKREKPNYGDSLAINKSLVEMQKEMSRPDKEIDNDMYGELKKSWDTGRTGGSGDAFISGLQGGLKKRANSDEKKGMDSIIETTQKMQQMVDAQNKQLAKNEKENASKEYIKPRVMAYLEQAQRMDPNARKVYLQSAMDEYNKASGNNYHILDAAGSEPWKVMISDDGQSEQIDLMDFIKTSEEKKYELYMNSNEMQIADAAARREYDMDIQSKQSSINANQARANKYNGESGVGGDLSSKKEEMVKSGKMPEGSMLFDEIAPHKEEFKHRITELKTEVEKLEPTEKGIKALESMGEIFKKYPNISTSLASWAASDSDSLTGKFLNSIVDQKQRDAVLELEKHAAVLGLGVIGQFKGQRPTDILKKLIIQSNPNGNFTYGAFKVIAGQYLEQFETQRERSVKAVDGWENRYFPIYSKKKEVFDSDNESSPNDYMEKVSKIPGITQADIDEIEKRLKEGKK
jgi:hypothetical protein